MQYLGGNAAFGAIDILNDTLPSGGTLALNAIGGGSALSYVFPSGFTAATGGTINVAAGVSVLVEGTLTDSGSLSFGSGDAVTFYGSQISVYGTMTATGDTFTNTGYTSTIQVYAGGELKASSSTFNLSQVAWAENSVLNGGDLTGDTFAGSGYSTPLSLPYGDVQYLGGNAAFGAIDILNDTLPSGGTLSLNVIGGGSALRYVFPTGFTAATGGTINVAAGVSVLVAGTLTDNGSLSLRRERRGDLLQLADLGVRDDDGHGRHVHQHRLHLDHPGLRRRRAEGVQQHLQPQPGRAGRGQRPEGRRPCRRLVQRLRGTARRCRCPTRTCSTWAATRPSAPSTSSTTPYPVAARCNLNALAGGAAASYVFPSGFTVSPGGRSSSGTASTCSSNRLWPTEDC